VLDCRDHRGLASSLLTLLLTAGATHAAAGQSQGNSPASPPAAVPEEGAGPAFGTTPERYSSPYQAFANEAYDQALEGFVDAQLERPEDLDLTLNIGNAHYQLKNYEEAEKAFGNAALSGDQGIRQQALYNLGNCAFRQGRLEEAVELYRNALELDPEDEAAKYNLEFVREEIRQRSEEDKERQEQQQQDGGEQDENQQGESGDTQQDQGQQGEEPDAQDSDGDGLPDEAEREGENPTDPQNPDTDGDGLSDGQEDENRNGKVDEGETDPNQQDSDGDGTPDGQDPQPTEPQDSQDEAAGEGAAGDPAQEEERSLTPEEAERYLQGLEEGRPQSNRPNPRGRRTRPAKDW